MMLWKPSNICISWWWKWAIKTQATSSWISRGTGWGESQRISPSDESGGCTNISTSGGSGGEAHNIPPSGGSEGESQRISPSGTDRPKTYQLLVGMGRCTKHMSFWWEWGVGQRIPPFGWSGERHKSYQLLVGVGSWTKNTTFCLK